MSRVSQRKRIIEYLEECFHRKTEFTHKDISNRAKAAMYLVQTMVKKLRNKGIIDIVGGKGVSGDPFRFVVVRSPSRILNLNETHS